MGAIIENTLASYLFPQTRIAILSLVFMNSEKDYHLREIARIVDNGNGAVQRELKNLIKAGILVREKRGNQVHYRANRACPVYDELKSLIVKTSGLADLIKGVLEPLRDFIEFVFIFGSFAGGKVSEHSDVDVMIIGDVVLRDIVKLLPEIHDKLNREINPVVYSVKEFIERRNSGNSFILNVLDSPKIMLYGEENELGLLG